MALVDVFGKPLSPDPHLMVVGIFLATSLFSRISSLVISPPDLKFERILRDIVNLTPFAQYCCIPIERGYPAVDRTIFSSSATDFSQAD